MKNAKERFHEVMDILGLNDYKVYTGIEGISKNMMCKLRQGKTDEVSVKILIPFCEAYPQVNANYILTGKGGMFIQENNLLQKDVEASKITPAYEDLIKGMDERTEELKKQIEALKEENKRLEIENNLFRELFGTQGMEQKKSVS